MIKTYLVPVLAFTSCVFQSAFADIADFSQNRDIKITAENIRTPEQGYIVSSQNGKKVYSTKDYELISEELSNGQARKLLEIQKKSSSDKESSGSLQIARFSGAEAVSLTQCDATDRTSTSTLKKGMDARNFNLQGCATATPKVCASMASFLGKNSEAMLKKINDCREVAEAMSALQKTMNEPLYKKTSDNNIQELSDAFYEMGRPAASLKNKILDGLNETSRAAAPETSLQKMGNELTNLVELTSACTRLDQINGDGVYTSAKKKHVSSGSLKKGPTTAEEAAQ